LPKGIEVIEQGDKKIVRNKVEGYEVTVPKDWEVRAKTINRVVIEVPPSKEELEIIAPNIIVNVFNLEKDMDFNTWLKDKLNKSETPECFKDKGDVKVGNFIFRKIEDICQYGVPIIEYYVKNGLKIYSFIDNMAGEEKIKEFITAFKF
jgi:hypothetical protein